MFASTFHFNLRDLIIRIIGRDNRLTKCQRTNTLATICVLISRVLNFAGEKHLI